MKRRSLALLFYILALQAFSQTTLLVEKLGTGQRYSYHVGDFMKLRISKQDTVLQGKLWSISDTVISIAELRPFDVSLHEINSVYKRFSFPNKLGKYLIIGSAAFCGIIVINHLMNHEQVFTTDLLYIPGSLLGGGLITLSLGQRRCKIGNRWKIKVLDIEVN